MLRHESSLNVSFNAFSTAMPAASPGTFWDTLSKRRPNPSIFWTAPVGDSPSLSGSPIMVEKMPAIIEFAGVAFVSALSYVTVPSEEPISILTESMN